MTHQGGDLHRLLHGEYGLVACEIVPLHIGDRRRVYHVRAKRDEFILAEVVATYCDQASLKDRLALLGFLHDNKFPVPKILSALSGSLFVTFGTGRFVLEEYVAGEVGDDLRLSDKKLAEAAITLGRYHRLMRTIPHPAWLPSTNVRYRPELFFDVDEALSLWRKVLDRGAGVDSDIVVKTVGQANCRLLEGLREEIDDLNQRTRLVRAELCHGDFRAPNLIFRGNDVVSVIDWEFARRLPRCWEVIRAACAMSRLEPTEFFNTPVDWGRLRTFVTAYHQMERLSVEEARLMARMGRIAALLPSFFLIMKYVHRDPAAEQLAPTSVEHWRYWEDNWRRLEEEAVHWVADLR